MIEITIEEGRIRAKGHAGDAAGCAAVSAVLYALAGGLENICTPAWRIDSGDAEITVSDESREARAMLLMAEVGLLQLAAAREDIRVENRRPP